MFGKNARDIGDGGTTLIETNRNSMPKSSRGAGKTICCDLTVSELYFSSREVAGGQSFLESGGHLISTLFHRVFLRQ